AMDGRFTISRHVDRRQDAHRGGLAGAVGPDKAEYLTGVETERHAIDGLERPKMTMQVGYFHHAAAPRMELCLSTFPRSHRGFRRPAPAAARSHRAAAAHRPPQCT